jgi:hypothetical protein
VEWIEGDDVAADEGIDELARRRNQRLADLRNQLVPGLRGITIGELADRASAPATDSPDPAAVAEFLRSRGHADHTIETVFLCLGLEPTIPTGAALVGSLADSRSGRRRLQALAEMEAMLLKD